MQKIFEYINDLSSLAKIISHLRKINFDYSKFYVIWEKILCKKVRILQNLCQKRHKNHKISFKIHLDFIVKTFAKSKPNITNIENLKNVPAQNQTQNQATQLKKQKTLIQILIKIFPTPNETKTNC